MALRDLTQADLEFYKAYNRKMIACHENEFLREIDPDLMRCFYRGFNTKAYKNYEKDPFSSRGYKTDSTANTFALSRIFTATNTILPNLYYENPRVLARPINGSSPKSAALMTAALNHYMKVNKQKKENQTAVMNSYFFGLGWKNITYQTVFSPQVKGPEVLLDPDERSQVGNLSGADNLEARDVPQSVHYETLVNVSESPMNVLIDHKGTINNFKVLTLRVKRTLHDLMTYGNYNKDALDEARARHTKQFGSRFDDRDIEVTMNQMLIKQRNGFWILTYLDEANLPLRYDKASHQGDFNFVPLSFTNEPDVRYPTSHMRVGSGVQSWVDKIASLQVEIISKMRNQIGVWEDALMPGAKQALKKNEIGGIVGFKKPLTAGVIQNLATQPVTADLFNMLTITQQNLTEIMGADEQRISGKSRNKTLGQDKIASLGTQIREGGMVDAVREWLVTQKQIEGQHLQQYGNSELRLTLSPKDFIDKSTVGSFTEFPIEFMTMRNPVSLRQYLKGEFEYSINVYEAVKPDKQALKQEYDEAILTYSNPVVKQALLDSGRTVDVGAIAEARAGTFEYINVEDFVQEIDSAQQAAMQVRDLLTKGGGQVPPQSTPIEEPKPVGRGIQRP